MKCVTSWLQSIKLKQIITVFLVSLTFLIGSVDLHGNQLQAQAEPVTPEATQYKVESNESEGKIKADRIKDNAEKSASLLKDEGMNIKNKAAEGKGKNIFENIKDKLNLEEPIDPGTKKAGEQLKEAAEDVIKAPQKAVKDISK